MSGALLPEADTAKSRWLKVGLGGCVLLAVCFGGTFLIGSDAGVSAQASVVPLACPQDGGDSRTTSDVSVEPAVIVPDSSGYPLFPVTYSAFSILGGSLDVVGGMSTIDTTDHLVAAWQNSTNCFGSSISRNAWVADANGAVTGEAVFSGPPANNFGSMAGQPLNQPMVGISPTADANGYWLVASDGGIFAFGDARFHGSTGNISLNQHVTGMAVTPDGGGYWLVASDGGVFAFDAPFYGSTGSLHLNKPIEAIWPSPQMAAGTGWSPATAGSSRSQARSSTVHSAAKRPRRRSPG